jgi:hypothetical protein
MSALRQQMIDEHSFLRNLSGASGRHGMSALRAFTNRVSAEVTLLWKESTGIPLDMNGRVLAS